MEDPITIYQIGLAKHREMTAKLAQRQNHRGYVAEPRGASKAGRLAMVFRNLALTGLRNAQASVR